MNFPALLFGSFFVCAAVSAGERVAFADDAPGAHDELKEGYALKQAGRCAEAVPHFVRSFDQSPTPKAALNRADCEAQLGDLVAAQSHARIGLSLATDRGENDLANVAAEQLTAIAKRLPRLTIAIAPGAPDNCLVSLDGARLDPAKLGIAIGLNPGPHEVVVEAGGWSPRRFRVTLAEGESGEIAAQPGPRIEAGAAATRGPVSPAEQMEPSPRPTSKVIAASVAGIGVVSLAVGVIAGVAATAKHGTLAGHCTDGRCPPIEQSELDAFHSLQTASTVGYGIGAAGVAGGVVLWVTAPEPKVARAQALELPLVGIAGRF
ncbi:MAG TPA: hypothetical protein VK841_22555 [Polyangiaceae bacterium]|nr:hypothetical protein [Polyangiaceae bacterium]